MNRRILTATAVIAMLVFGLMPTAVFARDPGQASRPLPDSIKSLKLDKKLSRPDLTSKVHRDPNASAGKQRVHGPPQGGALVVPGQ